MNYLIKMKIPFYKPLLAATSAAILASCGSSAPTIVSTPIENIDTIPLKVTALTDAQFKNWPEADLITDTIPGMSINKAYSEIIKNQKGAKVIVGVIDSGTDIEHEDLKNVIWTNTDEIPGNGKDDDNNGYIDDVHGWNFLGDAVDENLEFVRIYRDLKPKYEGKSASNVSEANREEFILYKEAEAEFEKKMNEAKQNLSQYQQIKSQLVSAHQAVSSQLGKEDYTTEELRAMQATAQPLNQYKAMLLQIQQNVNENIPTAIEELDGALDYYTDQVEVNLNPDLNGRAIVGDDPNDLDDRNYGNNNVMGPEADKENIKHGTHVAGIIAAQRNNGIGMNGVANNVEIMPVRAVPNGDEYDKDIALAIRYAVDNGAKVINTSFGKYFSTHPDWVRDAIKYAADNDVLIVNAAGNESVNLDEEMVYPNDQTPDMPQEISDNFLTVGALNYDYGSDLVAGFSNYGKKNVDVFAPGSKIWSTTPNNEYEFLQGTSMASPAVAGVAAMIRSYFPKLTAPQVKKIIMDSGLPVKTNVIVGGDRLNTQQFSELSTSGKIVNLYNALILASKVSK
ncbi:S8 family serine peptidase [Zunongwangia endophytica]|uniref:S8 family serine peptidase n=1 Tax=Zunongwangia endophytica TaxID=1808945 RepID=A0ABV8H3B3_9FLAO|nr:S8 family serine peptidase [Zunongwangia endophytica]MDN3595932.1 S8 family serine peptidase [Zunongwangia endophytica]